MNRCYAKTNHSQFYGFREILRKYTNVFRFTMTNCRHTVFPHTRVCCETGVPVKAFCVSAASSDILIPIGRCCVSGYHCMKVCFSYQLKCSILNDETLSYHVCTNASSRTGCDCMLNMLIIPLVT